MTVRPALVALAAVAIVASCAIGSAAIRASDPSASARIQLTVFAAASIQDAFDEIGQIFEASHPGVGLVFSFDASNALRTEIEQGAPADVFASADTTNPDAVAAAGLADGAPVTFAANRLAIIVPRGNPARIASAADLARPGVKIVAAGTGVPITAYANRAISRLALLPGYPPGFEAAIAANTVSREVNVRAIVTKIELGEGDAGIVYATDATSTPNVEAVPLPDSANLTASYAVIALRSSDNPAEAREFVAFLSGPAAQAVLVRDGFLPPR